uniref:purple acid phosphatase-like n=1 Tax=Fragaria vesca subsp. vesca TaxID=101020 RepID=UPI0005CAD167|nr:PREDICTED: purple acid phosphatase-like [Fragaria vesca subsp. vesca]
MKRMGVLGLLCASTWSIHRAAIFVVLGMILNLGVVCNGGKTSTFVRQIDRGLDMPLDSDVFKVPPGYNAPQQVHITQGDRHGKGVIVSWVTVDEPGSSTVLYWSANGKQMKAEGKVKTYNFYNYTSGYIHHTTIKKLKTLTHYERNPLEGEMVLFVGDLSYADDYPDHDNVRWDTWGRFTERSVAYQPWIWTAGNHEIDLAPEIVSISLNICFLWKINVLMLLVVLWQGETKSFKPYTHRYHVPYKASGSTAPYWYSIKRASSYIIVLASYSAYGKYTPQYLWLEQELSKVNRSETPWLIVLMHSPWYNSYNYHYMEGESMRVMFEPWFVQYKVDVVFSGHVHAYERSERISNVAYNITNGNCIPVKDQSAPVYITIGDGGNLEGLATSMTEPQPEYSAYREASFGHAIFDIKNRSHAYFGWHRNQDGYAVEADSMMFLNRHFLPLDDSTSA